MKNEERRGKRKKQEKENKKKKTPERGALKSAWGNGHIEKKRGSRKKCCYGWASEAAERKYGVRASFEV